MGGQSDAADRPAPSQVNKWPGPGFPRRSPQGAFSRQGHTHGRRLSGASTTLLRSGGGVRHWYGPPGIGTACPCATTGAIPWAGAAGSVIDRWGVTFEPLGVRGRGERVGFCWIEFGANGAGIVQGLMGFRVTATLIR